MSPAAQPAPPALPADDVRADDVLAHDVVTFAPPPTPGSYLALRRVAAGLSVEDVAARVSTEPAWAEVNRIAWLKLIECDGAPMGEHVIDVLGTVFDFDPEVLVRLDAIRLGSPWATPDLCRACGCSEWDPCATPAVDGDQLGCAWSETDPTLCTTCAARTPAASDLGEAA